MNKNKAKNKKNSLETVFDNMLKEKRDDIYKIFYDALEDFALGKAIKEGIDSGLTDEKEIYRILKKNGNRVYKRIN